MKDRRFVISADGELVASGVSEHFMQIILRAIFTEYPRVVVKVGLDSRFSGEDGE